MMIKAESYKIFSEIYCPIVPAPSELYFGDGYRSVYWEESLLIFTVLLHYLTILIFSSIKCLENARYIPILKISVLIAELLVPQYHNSLHNSLHIGSD